MLEFSPVTSSGVMSLYNIEAMEKAYGLLKSCLSLTNHPGLDADLVASSLRDLTVIYHRLGSVTDIPHRVVYIAQVVLELERLRVFLLMHIETERQSAIAGGWGERGAGGLHEQEGPPFFPSWMASLPTEDLFLESDDPLRGRLYKRHRRRKSHAEDSGEEGGGRGR